MNIVSKMSDNQLDNIDRKLWDAAGAGDEAAHYGHTPVVTRLLDAGWSLEARTGDGRTPLSQAALSGHLETAKCLLDQGAKIDTQDTDMWTPLHVASISGHFKMVETLLKCGANQEISEIARGELRLRRMLQRMTRQGQCSGTRRVFCKHSGLFFY